jgi:hypothetical protein
MEPSTASHSERRIKSLIGHLLPACVAESVPGVTGNGKLV